jgi:ketosteroid isomerase-like protein
MRDVAQAFEQSDLRPLLDAMDDNVVWKSGSTVEGLFRFGGEYTDYHGVLEVTSQIAMTYTFRRFRPKEIMSSGEIVWGLFNIEADYREAGEDSPNSKPVKFECAIRWRVRDRKIVEHQAFFDTAALLMQHGQLSPNP